jgi:hypothetical protein
MKSQKGNVVVNSGGLWGEADVSGASATQVAYAISQYSLRTVNARQVADFFALDFF